MSSESLVDTAELPPAVPCLLATVVIAAALLVPGHAQACGGVPTPSYTISGVTPSPGATGVARDMGIVLRGLPSSPPGGPLSFAEVQLIDTDSGERVPLTGIGWPSFDATVDSMAVHPAEPLEPLHRYRVEADPLDTEVGGPEGSVFVASFETSDALLEPLELHGEIELSLRGDEVDIFDYGPCGQNSTPKGQRRALIADVQLPVPSGGQGVYRAALHFTDHTPARLSTLTIGDYEPSDDPHDVQVAQWVKLESGEALTLEQEVFEEANAYAGCFALIVWDPAGHVASTTACLPSLSPEDIQMLANDGAPVPLASDEGTAKDQARQAVADARDRRDNPLLGCAFDAAPARRMPATRAWSALLLASLLGASALARRSSRRR